MRRAGLVQARSPPFSVQTSVPLPSKVCLGNLCKPSFNQTYEEPSSLFILVYEDISSITLGKPLKMVRFVTSLSCDSPASPRQQLGNGNCLFKACIDSSPSEIICSRILHHWTCVDRSTSSKQLTVLCRMCEVAHYGQWNRGTSSVFHDTHSNICP